MKSLVQILFVAFMGLGSANAQVGDPAVAPDAHAELEKVKSAFQETWVHPDANFTQYSKLYLWGANFEYRDVGPAQSTSSTRMSTRKREFGISDTDTKRSDVYLSNIGEATLVLELIDSETGDVLAVVSERRKILSGNGQIDSMSMPTSSVTLIAEVRRWAQRAGSKLASELDKAIAGK